MINQTKIQYKISYFLYNFVILNISPILRWPPSIRLVLYLNLNISVYQTAINNRIANISYRENANTEMTAKKIIRKSIKSNIIILPKHKIANFISKAHANSENNANTIILKRNKIANIFCKETANTAKVASLIIHT